nr:mechanosensitive ion channel domain-containing protein [uncultured Halomonas sp.]
MANDKTRQQLIDELRQAAAQNKDHENESPPGEKDRLGQASKNSDADASQHTSFARQLAEATVAWSEKIGSVIATSWQDVAALAQGREEDRNIAWGAFFRSVTVFAIVAVSTGGAFLALRALAGLLFSRIARLPEGAATRRELFIRRLIAVITGILVDVAVVFLAGGVGYVVGLYGVGDSGSMNTRHSLFVNAFILIELIKVVIRAVFADRYDNLRPLHIAPEIAAWWSIRLRWFIGVIGYALLVVVPILNEQLAPSAGRAVTFLVMSAAYLYALIVIFRNRRLLTARLLRMADKASLGFFSMLYRLFAWVWALLAVVYFTTLFLVSLLYPEQALPAMVWASAKTLVVAVVCLGISGLLSRSIDARIRFSDNVRKRLPMLEVRLNSYVPNALKVIRVIILILFVAITMNIWNIFDFDAWLDTDIGTRVVGSALHVVLILAAAGALWIVAASLIEYRMSPSSRRAAPSARQQTLLSLFHNALAVLIAVFTTLICLSQIGVNIGPLIAGAGVFGLAIGFGAQTMVKDIITGIFIQMESAINTGDYVTLAGVSGTAERLTIRSVSLRDIDGVYHIVPFSGEGIVSNYMHRWAYFRTEYRIAYREDIDNAIYHLRQAFEELKADPDQRPDILEDMTIPGVTALDESSVKIRIMIKTTAGMQWAVGRALNRLVKMHFDRAGIEIPYPHQRLWFGEDHYGNAPSAKVRLVDADEEDDQRAHYRPKKRRRGDDEAPEETGDAP